MPPARTRQTMLHRLTHWHTASTQITLRLRMPILIPAWLLTLLWYLARPIPVTAMAHFALTALLLLSYLWARQMALRLTAERKLIYTALQVGDQLEEIITLRNASPLPVLYAQFHDQSTFPDYTFSSVRAVDGSSTLEWRARAICTRRGVFTLGPWQILTGDPFGIFSVTHTCASVAEVLVYPPLAALPAELLPRGLMQGDERPLHQPTAARSINAVSARPYQPGDDLRHLHWRTTARRGEPYIKVFQPQTAATLWLVPDLDATVQTGAGATSTTETMVMLLASLAAELLKQRLAVGLLSYNGAPGFDHTPQVILPQRGQDHFWQILRALARLQPAPNRPFAQTLTQARSLISPRDLLLAITPALSTDWLAPLHHINRGSQHRAEVILLDAATFSAPLPTPALQAAQPERLAGTFVLTLAELGITARVLRQGDLTPISGIYGDLQRWEFITGGTGRAIARRAPREARIAQPPTAKWEPS